LPEAKPKFKDPFRAKLYEIIFEADTPMGKLFDIVLLYAIFASVLAVMLESVQTIRVQTGLILVYVEWIFTIFFTLEYIVRLYCSPKPLRYAFSFFGLIDLLAILPSYLSFYVAGTHSLLVIRGFRLLRIFRILKLGRYTGEAKVLLYALQASRPKITVFLTSILGLVLVMGSLMYLIEGEESGFTSIPRSIYWAIVTLTTVGYGDIAPQTVLGQMIASSVMIIGYAIIAVPTGIVSVELAKSEKIELGFKRCGNCHHEDHSIDAMYCLRCGEKLKQ
jgi:voltage-gated potassium channel